MFGETSVPVWTAVAAIAASLTILVTGVFSWLTIKLMREQIAPKVIVFLRHNPEKPSLIYIVIKNVGNDLALFLQFTPSRPIPAKAFGRQRRRLYRTDHLFLVCRHSAPVRSGLCFGGSITA